MFGRRPKTFTSSPLSPAQQQEMNTTQEKIYGSDLAPRQAAHVLAIGAGGICAQLIINLGRKGYGHFTVADDDRVELPNLTRQVPFNRRDVGKNKAIQLARHVARDAMFPLTITGQPFRFQELVDRDHDFRKTTFVICGVDNSPTRKAVSKFAVEHHLPVIHSAIGRDACQANVFVQQPGAACWGCAFPALLDDGSYPCGFGSTIDPLSVASGIISYVADSLVSRRPRDWNLREIFLDGSIPDRTRTIERRPGCEICQPRQQDTLPSPLPPSLMAAE